MGWLDGQVAIVTGGGSGIGLAVVERFVDEGARIGVLERDSARIDALNRRFDTDTVVACQGDVTSPDDNEALVRTVLGSFGRLDTYVANAGIWDYMTPLETHPPEKLSDIFDEIFAVNVKGYVLGARAAAAALRESRGSLIFTASSSSFYTGGGGPLYIASKHAVLGLVRALAAEFAPEIRVNGVAPGGTLTNLGGSAAAEMADSRLVDVPDVEDLISSMTPLGFASTPAQHAGIYVLLASRENSPFITGTVISSDGGIGYRK